jgi:exonuclease SbcD
MSPESTTRILFVGDMHLGRSPSGLSRRVLEAAGLTRRDLGPAKAWRRIVQAAIDLDVNAVALAGDLVEGDNARFEAFGHLESGVARLAAAGITVAAIAGNHDTEALPRLADRIDDFHLLGPGGTWSDLIVPGTTGPAVRLVGWSFPARHHTSSPLRDGAPAPRPGEITFGLLHGELDAANNTPYAPVSSAALKDLGYRGWFLGHTHKPDPVTFDGAPFYLGSVSGLDPAETGAHGPVLVEVSADSTLTSRRLLVPALRWEHIELDCTDLADPAADLIDPLLDAANKAATDVTTEMSDMRALGLRVELTGEVEDPAALERACRALDPDDLVMQRTRSTVFIQKVTCRASLKLDLKTIAAQADPPGLLARRILALENPATEVPGVSDPAAYAANVIRDTRRALQSMKGRKYFDLLDSDPFDDENLARLTADVARRTLAVLMSQTRTDREAQHAAG